MYIFVSSIANRYFQKKLRFAKTALIPPTESKQNFCHTMSLFILQSMWTYVTNIVEYKNTIYITYLQLRYKKNVHNNVILLTLFPFSLLLLQHTYALLVIRPFFECQNKMLKGWIIVNAPFCIPKVLMSNLSLLVAYIHLVLLSLNSLNCKVNWFEDCKWTLP